MARTSPRLRSFSESEATACLPRSPEITGFSPSPLEKLTKVTALRLGFFQVRPGGLTRSAEGKRRQGPVGLVAPGGTLLMISRSQSDDGEAKGPPWPMKPSEWRRFEDYGLKLVREEFYDIERACRVIPHVRAVFEKKD